MSSTMAETTTTGGGRGSPKGKTKDTSLSVLCDLLPTEWHGLFLSRLQIQAAARDLLFKLPSGAEDEIVRGKKILRAPKHNRRDSRSIGTLLVESRHVALYRLDNSHSQQWRDSHSRKHRQWFFLLPRGEEVTLWGSVPPPHKTLFEDITLWYVKEYIQKKRLIVIYLYKILSKKKVL